MKNLTRFEKKQYYKNYLKNNIFESLGINDDILEWTKFLYSLVLNEIYLFAIDLEDDEIYKQTSLKQSDKHTNSASIDFLKKDLLKILPEELKNNSIKPFNLKIDISFINIETDFNFNIETSNAYYDNDENLLYFDLYLPDYYINEIDKNEKSFLSYIKKHFKKYIKSIIAHELTHALEFKNKKSIITKDYRLNFVTNTIKRTPLIGTSKDMIKFLELIYLHLSFEENARITQIYIDIEDENIKNQDDFWKHVKKTNTWIEMYNLKTFNSINFYSNLDFKLNDKITDENLINVFKYLENDDDLKLLITQTILKDWNNTINNVNDYFNNKNNLIKNVPDSVIEDPMKFFKYYEKKFHKTWDNFNKNVGRLYSKIKEKK